MDGLATAVRRLTWPLPILKPGTQADMWCWSWAPQHDSSGTPSPSQGGATPSSGITSLTSLCRSWKNSSSSMPAKTSSSTPSMGGTSLALEGIGRTWPEVVGLPHYIVGPLSACRVCLCAAFSLVCHHPDKPASVIIICPNDVARPCGLNVRGVSILGAPHILRQLLLTARLKLLDRRCRQIAVSIRFLNEWACRVLKNNCR